MSFKNHIWWLKQKITPPSDMEIQCMHFTQMGKCKKPVDYFKLGCVIYNETTNKKKKESCKETLKNTFNN